MIVEVLHADGFCFLVTQYKNRKGEIKWQSILFKRPMSAKG